MVPPAPGLLSMTKGWPKASCSFCPTRRAAMSVACPGGQGTTTRTGFDGQDCAWAAQPSSAAATSTKILAIETSSRASINFHHEKAHCLDRPADSFPRCRDPGLGAVPEQGDPP